MTKTKPRAKYVNEIISFPCGTLHSLSWEHFLLSLLIFHAVGIKQGYSEVLPLTGGIVQMNAGAFV